MSTEDYVRIPPDSSGAKVRTTSKTIGANVVETQVVEISDTGSNATMTPAKTQQFPTALTTAGSLKVAVLEGMSGSSSVAVSGGSVGITGSVTLTANTGTDIGKSVTGSIGLSVTGSTLSGISVTVPVSGSLTSLTGGSVGITGSTTLTTNVSQIPGINITGSIGLSVTGSTLSGISVTVPVSGSLTSVAGGSIGITGSSTLPVSLVGTAISGSIGITGSATLPVNLTTGISITGSTIPFSGIISGSVGITGSDTLTTTLSGTSVGLTGSSIGLSVTGSAITGVSITLPVSGSLTTVSTVSALTGGSVGITGSSTLTCNQGTDIGKSITGSIGLSITGSTISNATVTLPVSGSLTTVSTVSALTGGSVGITGSVALTAGGSIGTSGSVALTITGSLVSLSGSMGGGLMLVGSGSSQKIKIYQAGYTTSATALHWFFYGNLTGSFTSSVSKFLMSSGSGTFRQTYIQPMISAADEALYIYSSGSDLNMGVDMGYVRE